MERSTETGRKQEICHANTQLGLLMQLVATDLGPEGSLQYWKRTEQMNKSRVQRTIECGCAAETGEDLRPDELLLDQYMANFHRRQRARETEVHFTTAP